MEISRRDFVRYATTSAAALGLGPGLLGQLERALAAASGAPVIWLSGSACTGCSVSLLNAVNPTIDQLLTTSVGLRYHSTVMRAAGDLAVEQVRSTAADGGFILVVEGGIPTGSGGRYCYVWDEGGVPVTMADAVQSLAPKAQSIVAVGCAAFGGIPSAYTPTAVKGVGAFLGRSVINVPGCPAHPAWIVGTLAQLIAGTAPSLDDYGRPRAYYAKTVHSQCPRRGVMPATQFGQDGRCLSKLGCRGKSTGADCPTRGWNNAPNWCTNANAPCLGCTEATFPTFPLRNWV